MDPPVILDLSHGQGLVPVDHGGHDVGSVGEFMEDNPEEVAGDKRKQGVHAGGMNV